MNKTVDTIVRQFQRKLGGHLESAFLFGSLAQGFYQPGESDVNLLLVVSEGTNIHALRQTFMPLWERHQDVLRRAPLIAEAPAFARHMQLNPMLAHHIARDGRQLFGAPDLMDSVLPPLNANVAYAYLAAQAVHVSQALTPQILDGETAAALHAKLRSMVRRIRREPLKANETSAQLLARVHHFLTPILERLPVTKQWAGTQETAVTSPILPGLQTIYKETGKMVLIFASLTPERIVRTDWARLAEHVGKQYTAVEVASTVQLCLAVTYERPLDVTLRKFEHNWGPDFVPTLDLPQAHVLRQAARLPSHILVDALPNALLTQNDDALHDIIHDFQNKLLNVQLEHELLCRFRLVERFTPPEPLPGRDAPVTQRIEAILKHLAWWAGFYTEQMQQHAA